MIAAAGVSTMTPTCLSPSARARDAKSRASFGVEIIGAITQTSAALEAAAMASACS